MAKPICVIKVDFQEVVNSRWTSIDIQSTQEGFEKKLNYEYYVFVVPKYNSDEPVSVEVFYEKDFTEIKYEELKEIIKQHLHDTV